MKNMLNMLHQYLAYNPISGVTDNPQQRNFDWSRKLYSIPVENPQADAKTIPPQQTIELFSGLRPFSLALSDMLTLSLPQPESSVYRLNVQGTQSAFRTLRTLTGLAGCEVTVNNNCVATFDFGAATTTAQIGDIIRLTGYNLQETNTVWNSINTGYWIIIGIQGAQMQCVRPKDQSFAAVAESVPAVASTDVKIYSPDGVQVGDKITFNNILTLNAKTYEVKDVSPSTLDFVSTEPLPIGIGQTYSLNSVQIFWAGKKFLYIETDQEIVVKLNGDVGNTCIVQPIKAGDTSHIGFFSKWGPVTKLEVYNKSLQPASVRFFTAE